MTEPTSGEKIKYGDSVMNAIRLIDEEGYPFGVKHTSNRPHVIPYAYDSDLAAYVQIFQKFVDGKPRVSSTPYAYDVCEGNVAGHACWEKIGYNGDVGATPEVISPQGGAYVFPTGATNIHIKSSHAEDKADGTGIRSLTIYYLDTDYVEKSKLCVPTGLTGVDTGIDDLFRVQNVRATTWGSGYAAAGNISVLNHAETVTYGYIAAGNNRQRQLVWTVPVGKTLYVSDIDRSVILSAANKSCTLTLLATYDNKANIALVAGLAFMPYSEVSLENSPSNVHFTFPLKFIAGTDLKVSGKATASAVAQVTLTGWTEDV